MRVETVPAQTKAEEQSPDRARSNRSKFRQTLEDLRPQGSSAEIFPAQPALRPGGTGTVPVEFADSSKGAAHALGIDRVKAAEASSAVPPLVTGVSTTFVTEDRHIVDVQVRAAGDQVIVAMAAAPHHAERLATHAGTLGRKLSGRGVRARSLRVTSGEHRQGDNKSRPSR
ncbi:MAG: hypothetical protein IT175_10420 [Acidobacteria bacterium]|nr:hypothetical protein [Acidobacteriota bacterium]